MHIEDEHAAVRPGSTVYIPPMAKQCITNSGTTNLTFICILDPAWRKEDEEVL
jgi:mannose-6-phosphate isomerase-like protein (cupin superfamily)